MTRHQAPHPKVPIRPAWSLEYEKYPAAELRTFIEARIGTTLSKKERRTIGNCNRFQLEKRLYKLDLASTFPRFMELPPELRLSVYELLLVDTSVAGSRHVIIAFVISWRGCWNKRFNAGEWREVNVLSKKEDFLPGRMTMQLHPMIGTEKGGVTTEHTSLALNLLFCKMEPGFFRLPILIFYQAVFIPFAIACLCLSVAGASKMKELTINVAAEPRLLRRNIVVKFEGIAEILKTSTTAPKTVPHAEAFYGRHIARIRQRCNEEIAKHGSDLVALRGIEAAHFGDEFVTMEDLVDLSTAWAGMRSEADRVEAMGLEKASLF
ncbi:hypothetical protein MBLNU13_g08993t2 [Cladosporium sp. NU13]